MSKLNIESGPSGSQIWLAKRQHVITTTAPVAAACLRNHLYKRTTAESLTLSYHVSSGLPSSQVKLDLEVAGKPVPLHEKHWKSGIVKASSTKLTALAVFCAALEHRGSHSRHTWSKTKIARPSLRCSGKGPEKRNALNIESGSPNGSRMSRSMQIQCRVLPFFFCQAWAPNAEYSWKQLTTFWETGEHFKQHRIERYLSCSPVRSIFFAFAIRTTFLKMIANS